MVVIYVKAYCGICGKETEMTDYLRCIECEE